jgi:hypothetical protein
VKNSFLTDIKYRNYDIVFSIRPECPSYGIRSALTYNAKEIMNLPLRKTTRTHTILVIGGIVRKKLFITRR